VIYPEPLTSFTGLKHYTYVQRNTLLEKKNSVQIFCTVADVIRSYGQNSFINLMINDKRNFAGDRVLS
jgi:hypothetical protein